jgi:hypothetical protein
MIGGFIGNPIGGVINVNNFSFSVTTGSYAIAGQAAAFVGNVLVSAGSYTITGQSIAFATKMAANAGSYALAGQSAVFNETLLGAAGSYALTGQTALFATRMMASAGAYALTGQSAAFNPIETVSAGAYAITGSAITFKLNWACAAGAYVITGAPVTLSQVINGSGGERRRAGETKKPCGGRLKIERRKIIITDDEGRVRKVDLLGHLKPPPPFAPAPEWVLPDVPDLPTPADEALRLPLALPRPRLPESLLALQDARDENDLVELLTNSPDPLVEEVRRVLGLLAATGQLERLVESA